MKRIVCFLFLILSAISYWYFKGESVEISEIFNNPISIKIITNNFQENNDSVFNGNYVIAKLSDLSEIKNYDYCGITIVVSKDFNINTLINDFKLHINKSYNINEVQIMEGNFKANIDIPFSTMQIAVKEDCVVVGFPMILDSF